MDNSKFEEIIKKRIKTDDNRNKEEFEKEKKTIRFLYQQIISEFADEFEKKIESYNEILKNNNIKKRLFLYYDNAYNSKILSAKDRVIILLNDENAIPPKWGTPLNSYSHFLVSFIREPGIEEKYYFRLEYFIWTGHAQTENDFLDLKINEQDKNSIQNEIKGGVQKFLEAYFEKGEF
jgi:hypothetical protein